MAKNVRRLVRQFRPENYDLELRLDEVAMRFFGKVVIAGRKVGRPSQRVTLHQNRLKIVSAKITKHDKKGDFEQPVSRINNQQTLHEVRLHSSQMIYPGNFTLEIEFEGKITDGMTGIYPCYFKQPVQIDGEKAGGSHSDRVQGADEKRTESYMKYGEGASETATPQSAESTGRVSGSAAKQASAVRDSMLIMTQFESHYARQAFPCIDEPEAKATFNLTLITRPEISVLSNTPVKQVESSKQQVVSGLQETIFETTPRMSPYLLAFVVGDLQKKPGKTKDGTEINIWATVAQPANSLDYALDIATKSVEYFEDYFGVKYPLAKLDHVACPDFSNGAMENWGLITYRERVLLAYPGHSGQSILEQIALVISHETSHQWFGDLVTMKWWNELWLNESFANMMEYQAVDAIRPDWKVWDMFVAAEGLSALRRDATPGVQTIKAEVHHPDEINTLFDPSIVYAKGGRLLNMLKNYIGNDAFRRGLKLYFDKYAYGNTEGADLWAELSKASGKDVAAFMNPWIEQSGFPLVTVEQTGDEIILSQEHFLDDPSQADKDRLWPVPLFAEGLPDEFSSKELTIRLSDYPTIRLNSGAVGHYLVRYKTDKQKKAILKLVEKQEISEAERLMLLNSSSMLSRAGYGSFADALGMLASYKNEASEPVWDMLALIIGETRRFIDLDETLEPKIKQFIDRLTMAQVKRLGWSEKKSDSAADQKLRALVLGLSTYSENPESIKKAAGLFKNYQKDPASVAPELRTIGFSVAVKQKVTSAFDYLLKLHDSTSNSDLQADICSSLTATHDPSEAKVLLGRIKDNKIIKPQDADRWLIYLMSNRCTRKIAWDWLENNWDWIEQTYAEDKSYDMLPRYAASTCNTLAMANRYDKFFAPKVSEISLKHNIELGQAEITTRVAWLLRDQKSIQVFFTTPL